MPPTAEIGSRCFLTPLPQDVVNLLAVNHSLSTSHTFNLGSLGIGTDENYLLMYVQSIDQPSTWVTNQYTSANLSVALTAAAWPHRANVEDAVAAHHSSTPVPNALPRYGAWLVMPAPRHPWYLTAIRTNSTARLTWTAPTGTDYGGYEIRKETTISGTVYKSYSYADFSATSFTDLAPGPYSPINYFLVTTNGYCRSSSISALLQ